MLFVWIILMHGNLQHTIKHVREFRNSKFNDSCYITLLNYISIFTFQGALFKDSTHYSHPTIQFRLLSSYAKKSFIIMNVSPVGLVSTTYRMCHKSLPKADDPSFS